MKYLNSKILFTLVISICQFAHLHSQTGILGGKLATATWTKASSPYYINGNCEIPLSERLVIDAGAEIIFTGNYKLTSYGKLIAIGNEKQPIIFTSPNDEGWQGITIESQNNDSTIIDYCQISRSRNSGITIKSSRTRVSNCHIYDNSSYNGGGISCLSSSPKIYKNLIERNRASGDGGGIYCSDSTAEISFNMIKENYARGAGGGIRLDRGHSVIANNVIILNEAGARAGGFEAAWGGQTTNCLLINNTIVKNTAKKCGGIYSWRGNIKCINNLIWGNTNGNVGANSPAPIMSYSAIENNPGYGWLSNIINLSSNNMNTENGPMFQDPENNDFTPLAGSPLIGSGTPKGTTIGHTDKTNYLNLKKMRGTITGDKKGGKISPVFAYLRGKEKLTYKIVVNDGYKVVSAKYSSTDVTNKLKKTSFGYQYTVKKNNHEGELQVKMAKKAPFYNERNNQAITILHDELKENVTIETENEINVSIRNSEGKTVKSEQLNQLIKSKINIQNLLPGVYFIDIKTGDETITKKITIK